MGKLAPEGMPGGVMLPEFYNMLFTMHATIMIFFVIIPMLIGAFGNFVIPLQIGARDMAFPKLNMMSYWVAVAGGRRHHLVVLRRREARPAAGWTSYAPLSSDRSRRGQTLWLDLRS